MNKLSTNDLDSFFMPFTFNRSFKKDPRLLVSAKGMYYQTHDGRDILDGAAGLWCVNAGHGREKITKAIQNQAELLDYAPTFQLGHPLAFQLASQLALLAPGNLNHVFYANSGSEAVDTALKIALAYHQVCGEGQRFRLIGREKAYHGVGFGGISVGGLGKNRMHFGAMLPGVDHIRHTLDLKRNAFTKGEPTHGVEFADELERLIELHEGSRIAAVIVEPVPGSAGVFPPPKGYLKRLREICDQHGILLIFDEVITGFGRLGAPFAAEYFDVMPDMICIAKGMSNGAVPMGGVLLSDKIYNAFMQGPEESMEIFHGYTYSGHPLACAAALATLEIYREEKLLTRVKQIEAIWQEELHKLRDNKYVIDIRNQGLMGAIQLESIPGKVAHRAHHVFKEIYKNGAMIRFTGDTLAMSPPLIIQEDEIKKLMHIINKALKTLD